MRKGAKIGLGITILFVSVIVGIASIPDDVLNETTTAIENEAKIFSAPEKPELAAPSTPETLEPTEPKAPEPSTPETPEPSAPATPEPAAPATPEPTEPESSEPEIQSEEPEANVIRVEIRDGVGFGDK
jgi:outer membrane biosynthesis protein TonB